MWTKEPALIVGFVGAAIALGVSFGLPVSAEQVGFIMAFVTASLLGGALTAILVKLFGG